MLSSFTLNRATEGEVLDLDWGQIVWKAARNLGNSETMTFGLVTIKAGAANPRHRHPNCDEILHLISGHIEHSLGDETFEMNAGDTISIPVGVVHNARNLAATDAQMTICFSSADRQTEGE